MQHNFTQAFDAIARLADQGDAALRDIARLSFPDALRHCDAVLFCGMGGSSLCADVALSVLAQSMRVPAGIWRDYGLPASVNRKTLVVCVSYSGNTEETLDAFREARRRGARVVAIAGGGALARIAKRTRTTMYQFDDTQFNPSHSPRMGLGLTTLACIALLQRLGYARVTQRDVRGAIAHLRAHLPRWSPDAPRAKNGARKLASVLAARIPLYIAAEHLVGNLRVLANQTNETAKTFAIAHALPELNHHLMEGLQFPKESRALHAILFDSTLYHKRTQTRLRLTRDILKKNGIAVSLVRPEGRTPLEQALWTLGFGSALTLHLADAYHVDPTRVPWVDTFKSRLK